MSRKIKESLGVINKIVKVAGSNKKKKLYLLDADCFHKLLEKIRG